MENPILFYDGLCGLCNRTVQFTLKRDRKAVFKFATLQGPSAAKLLPPLNTLPDSVVLLSPQGHVLLKSQAIVSLLRELPWPWNWLGWLGSLFPLRLRDWAYDWVARHRTQLFGRHQSCPLPKPQYRPRFLD